MKIRKQNRFGNIFELLRNEDLKRSKRLKRKEFAFGEVYQNLTFVKSIGGSSENCNNCEGYEICYKTNCWSRTRPDHTNGVWRKNLDADGSYSSFLNVFQENWDNEIRSRFFNNFAGSIEFLTDIIGHYSLDKDLKDFNDSLKTYIEESKRNNWLSSYIVKTENKKELFIEFKFDESVCKCQLKSVKIYFNKNTNKPDLLIDTGKGFFRSAVFKEFSDVFTINIPTAE